MGAVALLSAHAGQMRRTLALVARVLAGLSAVWIATSALLLMPAKTFDLMCQVGMLSAC